MIPLYFSQWHKNFNILTMVAAKHWNPAKSGVFRTTDRARDTSKVFVSGPCGVMQVWRLAPPGRKPSAFAYKRRRISEMQKKHETFPTLQESLCYVLDFPLKKVVRSAEIYLITTMDKSHEFTHAIAMEIGRPKCVLCDQPPWWENHKVE